MADAQGIETAPIELPVTCRHCIFFNRMATYSDKCKNLGRLPVSDPCRRFVSDIYQFDAYDDPGILKILKAINKTERRHLPILAALIHHESRNRRFGFSAGERVVIKLFKGEYLSNYARAVVLSCTKKYVFVQGKKGFRGMVYHDSVIRWDDWVPIKQMLIKKEKIKDPNHFQNFKVSKADLDGYEPPDVDGRVGKRSKKIKISKRYSGARTIQVR